MTAAYYAVRRHSVHLCCRSCTRAGRRGFEASQWHYDRNTRRVLVAITVASVLLVLGLAALRQVAIWP